MRMLALAIRILFQTIHDVRTLLLILLAPLVVLTMIYFILSAEDRNYSIGIIDRYTANEMVATDDTNLFAEQIEIILSEDTENHITISHMSVDDARQQIKDQHLDGAVYVDEEGNANIFMNGSDVSVAGQVLKIIKTANAEVLQEQMKKRLTQTGIPGLTVSEPTYQIEYVTGSEDGTLFDKFGIQLIGIIVFFFVFLIAGIHFLNECTMGTMEKLMSTPIRRYEIVGGYILGFGIMAILQSTLITVFAVYVLGLNVKGNILLVLLITFLTAINALCLGILLSTIANSEFQMVQFIPIVILPQIFLAGLFRISGIWEKFGYLVPLHYTSHALTNIMIIGNGLSSIELDLCVLSGLSILFI